MTIQRRNYGRTGHGYKIDGVKATSVTKILDMVPKHALVAWAAGCAADYAVDYWAELEAMTPSKRRKALANAHNDDRDAAAGRGTEVHRLAERINNGEDPEVPELLRGHVESYRDWLAREAVEPIATELVVANRAERYCGTADLVAHLRGRVGLVELKTSRSGIFFESALQACGYVHCDVFALPDEPDHERKLDELGIDECWALWVRGDGWEMRPLDTGELTWAYFRRLAWLLEHDDEARGWVGDPVEPQRDSDAYLAAVARDRP